MHLQAKNIILSVILDLVTPGRERFYPWLCVAPPTYVRCSFKGQDRSPYHWWSWNGWCQASERWQQGMESSCTDVSEAEHFTASCEASAIFWLQIPRHKGTEPLTHHFDEIAVTEFNIMLGLKDRETYQTRPKSIRTIEILIRYNKKLRTSTLPPQSVFWAQTSGTSLKVPITASVRISRGRFRKWWAETERKRIRTLDMEKALFWAPTNLSF